MSFKIIMHSIQREENLFNNHFRPTFPITMNFKSILNFFPRNNLQILNSSKLAWTGACVSFHISKWYQKSFGVDLIKPRDKMIKDHSKSFGWRASFTESISTDNLSGLSITEMSILQGVNWPQWAETFLETFYSDLIIIKLWKNDWVVSIFGFIKYLLRPMLKLTKVLKTDKDKPVKVGIIFSFQQILN